MCLSFTVAFKALDVDVFITFVVSVDNVVYVDNQIIFLDVACLLNAGSAVLSHQHPSSGSAVLFHSHQSINHLSKKFINIGTIVIIYSHYIYFNGPKKNPRTFFLSKSKVQKNKNV